MQERSSVVRSICASEVPESLNVYLYSAKDTEKMLLIISRMGKDKSIIKKYRNNQLRCANCKKLINPKTQNLGAVLETTNKRIKLLCRNFACYEKALR